MTLAHSPERAVVRAQRFELDSARIGLTAHVLSEIGIEHVNLVQWRRSLRPAVVSGLSQWMRAESPAFDRVLASGSDLACVVDSAPAPVRAWLLADLRRLVRRFTEIAGIGRLRLALNAVRGDMCRKFHVDYVRFRLITTYVGPGTEWAPNSLVLREALADSVHSGHEQNPEVLRDVRLVERANAGDVLILKGERQTHLPAVHRSPPIAGSGRQRLVLTLTSVD